MTTWDRVKGFLLRDVSLAKNEFGQDPKGEVALRQDGKRPNTTEVMASGLDATRWNIYTDDLSVEWVARALRLAETGHMLAQMSLMEQMEERDPSLHSAMMTRRTGAAACERIMQPARTPKGKMRGQNIKFNPKMAQEVADDVQWVIDQVDNFDGVILDSLDAVGKSVAALEIDWNKSQDGTIDTIRHVEPRLYNYDTQTGDLYFFNIDNPLEQNRIYPKDYDYKYIIHRSKLRAGHACRGGVLRTVAWCFVFRNYTWKDQSVYCEIFGMPMRVGKYKPTATPQDKNQLAAMLRQMASNAWALISEATSIEFNEAVNRGQEPFSAFLSSLRSEYFLAILGQEGTNVAAKYGSKGDTQIKQMVRQDILESDCKQLENTLKWQLLYPIVLYRWGKQAADLYTPNIHFKYEPPLLLSQEAETDSKMLVEAGLGSVVSKKSMCRKYGYEMVDGDAPDSERVLPRDFQPGTPNVPPAGPGGGDSGKSGDPSTSKKQRDNVKRNAKTTSSMAIMLSRKFTTPEERHQEVIDGFIEQLVAKADETMRPIVAPLLAVVAESKTYEELKAKLEDIYSDLDSDQLQVVLGWSMMMARLFGQKTVVQNDPRGS